MSAPRLTDLQREILNALDHGGELHAFEIGAAQEIGKRLAKLRRMGLVYKRTLSEGQSALWEINDIGRQALAASVPVQPAPSEPGTAEEPSADAPPRLAGCWPRATHRPRSTTSRDRRRLKESPERR